MKKTALLFLISILVIVGLMGYRNSSSEQANSQGRYFNERLATITQEDTGAIPIEGYDANLLLSAFPGFEEADFDGVITFNGRYVYTNDTLLYERDNTEPITSAERTVSSAGYGMLLEQVALRLNMPAVTEDDVDAIILLLNTSKHIQTGIDQSASALNVMVTPHEVLEDSRCAVDVVCISAGTVRVRATLESGLGTANQIFQLNQPITTEAEDVILKRVEPEALQGVEIDPSDYVFIFEIKKRKK
ncbi:MAG: hypothetical protein Q8P93_00070 [bacterium]|nr:hypothetical protein [bacterium]